MSTGITYERAIWLSTIYWILNSIYNDGWNEYDELGEDGTVNTVINPTLSAHEFEAKFSLNTISICGDSSLNLWYDDSGLFWGHSVFVSFLEGLEDQDARAELFG